MADEALRVPMAVVPKLHGWNEGEELIGLAQIVLSEELYVLLVAVVLALPEGRVDTRESIVGPPHAGRRVHLVGVRLGTIGSRDEEDLKELPLRRVIDGFEVIPYTLPNLKVIDHRKACDLTTDEDTKDGEADHQEHRDNA